MDLGITQFRRHVKAAQRAVTPSREPTFSLNNYDDKLLPLLYHTPRNKVKQKDVPMIVKNSLAMPITTVTSMKVRPGEPNFVYWYFVSSYFPLISACLGPLANMISIISLVQHWRIEKATGKEVSDEPGLIVLNSMSLVFGILANISLLMNFSGTIKYLITQVVSIICFLGAVVVLMVDIIITNRDFIGQDPKYSRSEGFWFAVFTTFYYFCCAVTLLVNFLGYKLNKYPATFNLDTKQRTLMIYTICFAIWSVFGSVVMAHMIDDLTYGSSLYYCIVSFLTIGLGDILPKTPGAKVMVLILSLIGVLIMGLIVAMIRQVVMTSGGPTIFWNHIERDREKLLAKLKREHTPLTADQAFHKMRVIRRRAHVHQLNVSLASTIIIFMVFWLIGATVFHFCEGWSYFNGVYFCFLCLITIGYGDYAPKTPLGRVFFVSWAVAAVPLMTILISNVGDKLFGLANHLSFMVSKALFRDDDEDDYHKRRRQSEEVSDDIEREVNIEEDEEDYELSSTGKDVGSNHKDDFSAFINGSPLDYSLHQPDHQQTIQLQQVRQKITTKMLNQKETYENILSFLNQLKPLISDSVENPLKRYSHSEWSELLDSLNKEDVIIKHPDGTETVIAPITVNAEYNYFWLSERSPLRLPLKEPNYLIMKVFFKIEKDLNDLIDAEVEDMEQLRSVMSNSSVQNVEMLNRTHHEKKGHL
ncbi:outward-rectifier potassium channel [Scheffersomyces stipitis CBS 6054]|uniref:Outward-rectifier potassium channel n=1 Tax=Scheffersomyces stipitis (strain ATCC 58785 / CBS 6054 / NBRC 10063 / NRRL Y-11545) TaxID=322104 RepID=A3LSV6_PICST|nr:outward-rectifier potassium channel [Scheffersomyces stipitis CBS 6054]ABN65961.2 outward-rectifier potassium channel [Scheffersomyces stipitis CBS 6054]